MIYLGIDLSSTNTGVVAVDEKGDIVFTYLISPKSKNIDARYLDIKSTLLNIIKNYDVKLGIESPSFFSKGKVITLAAGWGYIYYSLLELGYQIYTFTPSQIKKYATNNGRADKKLMYESLNEEAKLEIDTLTYKKKDDIVDAYWIAKLTRKEINERNS